jgi:AraC-like DNA-binding protein
MDKALLKENRIHGDPSFPLCNYYMDITTGDVVLDCHWHDEMEFLKVSSGKAVFQIETDYYDVHAGEAIIINSGELHAGYPLENSPCSYEAIVFSSDLLHSGSVDLIYSKYIEPIVKNRLRFKRHITGAKEWESELLLSLSKVLRLVQARQPAYEMLAKSELLSMLAQLVVNSKLLVTQSGNAHGHLNLNRLKSALKYMNDNYSQKLSTRGVSAFLGISEGYFCRLFKHYFKRTPMDYLNYYRITQAIKLLEETELKVLEVAMEVGFDNISYFISTFKHYVGITPSKYRSQGKAN